MDITLLGGDEEQGPGDRRAESFPPLNSFDANGVVVVMDLFQRIGVLLSWLVLHDLAFVMAYDIMAFLRHQPTITGIIKAGRLAWPIGILAVIVVSFIVLTHFVVLRIEPPA